LVSPQWITSISLKSREVAVDLSRAKIKGSPAYDDASAITREDEVGLYGYYDRDGYWVADLVPA